MYRQLTKLAAMVFLLAALTSRSYAQADAWFQQPDHRDFPWKMRVIGPRLTFQQRFLVQVRADVSVGSIQTPANPGDLHFLVRVADERGKWFRGEEHNRYEVPPNLDGQNEIQFTCGLYLRPGTYTVAVLLYDSASGRHNLSRRALRVSPLKHDPLPDADRFLPAVEFLPEVPVDSAVEATWPTIDDAWTLGQGREWLPVRNSQPLRVEVVLNLSNWLDPRLQGASSAAEYRQRVGRMLQIGSVLSHLALAHGCVRLSGLDIHQSRVIFDRAAAAGFQWQKLLRSLSPVDQDIVSVQTLEKRGDTALFFRRFLSDLFYDPAACPEFPSARTLVIVAGASHAFPERSRWFGVWPEMPCNCALYYLRADQLTLDDDIDVLIKRVKAHRFQAANGEKFRSALARLIADMEAREQPGAVWPPVR